MSDFTDAYVDLLVKQYHDQPNARAEITAMAAGWETVRDLYRAFADAFDLDQAIGAQQDIIGKVVGLSRVSSFTIPASLQGGTPSQLSDTAYRALLKVKIAKNTASALMVSGDRVTIQDVIQVAFDGGAFVDDNYNMSLSLYFDAATSVDLVRFMFDAGLLPKPQGVRYAALVQAPVDNFFGFDDNPNAAGFGDTSNALGGGFGETVT